MLVKVGEIQEVTAFPKIALSTLIMNKAPYAPKNTINLLYLNAIIIARKKVLSPISLTIIVRKEVVKPSKIP